MAKGQLRVRVQATCGVEACEAPHRSRGLCERHYYRQRRHGDVSVRLRTNGMPSDLATAVPCPHCDFRASNRSALRKYLEAC